jgi:hypothetical protein
METENKEFWKSIKDYPNYEVSNHGRVRNTKTDQVLKFYTIHNRYNGVHLHKNGTQHPFHVSRIVGKTFIPNSDPENLTEIDHIDRNTKNNHVTNLRWVNRKTNAQNRNLSKRNHSGVRGVSFQNRSSSGPQWIASISNLEGKTEQKTWSARKYSDAFERATQWRLKKEQDYGYTPIPVDEKRNTLKDKRFEPYKTSSGVRGVSRIGTYWIARIYDGRNVKESKRFDTQKYPNALKRAIQWRREKEQEKMRIKNGQENLE